MRMYGHGRGYVYPCLWIECSMRLRVVWRCACKGRLCEKCIYEPMQIVYHGAYRRVCVNVPIASFGGGTENPYLCSAMRFRAHGTSYLCITIKLFELWKLSYYLYQSCWVLLCLLLASLTMNVLSIYRCMEPEAKEAYKQYREDQKRMEKEVSLEYQKTSREVTSMLNDWFYQAAHLCRYAACEL